MFTTTTTRDVKMHGWTLPAGSTIRAYQTWTEFGYTTVSAYADHEGTQWSIAVPFDAVPASIWKAGLPHQTY